MTAPDEGPWHTGPVGHAQCSAAERLAALGRVPFLGGLDDVDLHEVHALARARGFAQGEVVVSAGAPADAFLVVASGTLKWSRPTPAGKEVVLDLLGPGDVCGGLPLLGDRVHADDIQGQTPGCLLVFGAASFAQVLDRYPAVTRCVLEVLAERLAKAHDVIRSLSVASVEDRLCSVLARLSVHLGDGRDAVRLPLTQQDLAGMVGSTVETVNRVLSRLRKRGIVDTGRGWVRVTNPGALVADD